MTLEKDNENRFRTMISNLIKYLKHNMNRNCGMNNSKTKFFIRNKNVWARNKVDGKCFLSLSIIAVVWKINTHIKFKEPFPYFYLSSSQNENCLFWGFRRDNGHRMSFCQMALMPTYLQWCGIESHQDPFYAVNWYFSRRSETLKVVLCCFLSYVLINMAWGFQMSYYSSSLLKGLQNCDLLKLEV